MAARRVPALAFLAAFLVAFNVFSSHGADRRRVGAEIAERAAP